MHIVNSVNDADFLVFNFVVVQFIVRFGEMLYQEPFKYSRDVE